MTEFLGQLLAGIIRYSLYWIEAVAVFILLLWACGSRRRKSPEWFRTIRGAMLALARRRGLAVGVVLVLPLLIRAALLPVLPPRLPEIADDFAYLLAGETFALGRLTNPAHPMWVHFESFHILHHPSYMSMYFPAQGLFLAAGQVLAGYPWVGVWLSVGLMCAAICWMLQGWLPPRWALLGALLAVMRLGIFGYWMNSFFGGAVPALGGALVLGALPRILREAKVRHAVLLGLGLVILATSRPFEGLLLAVPVAVALLTWICGRKSPPLPAALSRVAVPIAAILGMGAAFMGYYNWRVTGDALRTPQALNRATYAQAGYFLWQHPNLGVTYRHKEMRDFYVGEELRHVREAQTAAGLAHIYLISARDFWLFYLGPVLTLPLAALPWVVRDRRMRFLVIASLFFTAGLALNIWFYPHYAAPMTAALYAILVQGLRHIRVWTWRGRPAGAATAWGIPLICLGMLLVRVCVPPTTRAAPPDIPMTWYWTRPGGVDRAAITKRLDSTPGRHLILVRYSAKHNCFEEWVYNEPDIDNAKIVWAREMDPASNRRLLRYFRDRSAWVLLADSKPPGLIPYGETAAAGLTPKGLLKNLAQGGP